MEQDTKLAKRAKLNWIYWIIQNNQDQIKHNLSYWELLMVNSSVNWIRWYQNNLKK